MIDEPSPERVPERRLAAILAADIAGYSRLMGRDEAGTVRDLKAHQAVVLPMVGSFGGTIVDTAGDGILAAFPSAVRAVECAVAIQSTMDQRNRDVPEERRMLFRIGINLGDLIHEEARIYGDGVNVAARIEGLASPGGVCLSGTAYDQVRGKLDCGFEDLGEQSLKNIERSVRVYRVVSPRSAMRSVTSGSGLPERPSIAVLPFDNMSAEPGQDFFSDGITEDITTALSKLKGFFVIARNTMFTFKGKPVDVRAVGRELGVRYVLEGSVRKAGDRIRVTAQLIEAESGSHLWGDHYDRRLDDIFAVQDEITASVVGRIGSELLAAEHARASRKPPQNLNAWEWTLRALFQSSRLSDEGSRAALALLDQAIAVDPEYAQALGLRAWIVVWRAVQGWDRMADAVAQARSLGERAIASNEDEPWAWVGRSCIGIGTRDTTLATSSLKRAVQLNPNFAMAHGLLGIAHAFGGRSSEAIASIDQAVRLSPREIFHGAFPQQYAFAYFQGAQYELGLQFARQSHSLRPGHSWAMVIGAACAGHLGDIETGATFLRDLKAIVPDVSPAWVEVRAPYVLEADRHRLAAGLVKAGLS